MGLVDLILLGLCMNSTCLEDKVNDLAFDKRVQLQSQAKELKDKTLRIATIQNYPLSAAKFDNNGVLLGDGIAFEFINFLQEKYNFKYEVLLPQEDSLDANAKGIIGMLHRNEADIAAAFLPIFPTFWEYIRYSRSLDKGEWVVLMKRPPVSATGSGLLAPFTLQVWLLILVSLVGVGPVIYLLIIIQARLCKDDEEKIFPLPACIWFVYGALLKQGSTLSPKTDSSRLLFSTWWIFITILTAFYTANLTAFLTLSRFTLPINDLNDIGQKKYSWVAHKGSAIEEETLNEQNFKDSVKGSVWDFPQLNASDILEIWVKKHNYMYIAEKPIVEHLMYNDYLTKKDPSILEADRCTYVITTWTVTDHLRAFAYSKEFPFYELFNNIIEHLVEAGIVKYMLRSGLPNTQICPLDLQSKERQLQNSDLLMTYYIVAGGFVISAVIFIGELLWTYCQTSEAAVKHTVRAEKKYGVHTFGMYNKIGKNSSLTFDEPHRFLPPPPYHALFNPSLAVNQNEKMLTINGTNYCVKKSLYGDTRLVPVRAPSAFLFQYAN